MSFWTWLDRNGDGKGCRLHCEPQLGVHVTHEPSITDGGSHD